MTDEADNSWDAAVARHPAGDALRRLFPQPSQADFTPTGRTRADYLPVVAGIVDFFRRHQDERGAILDPYVEGERQYSTPAFAFAAALLAEQGRSDLRDPAERAFGFALRALAGGAAADGHPDFYIPLLMHARRLLAPRIALPVLDEWDGLFRSIVPEDAYRDTTGRSNWNLVNVAGECLRAQDGLVAPERRDAHAAYIERSLAAHESAMTRFGMYEDPHAPLAYDAFPRLWMEDVLAEGAYAGAHRDRWEGFLTLGGLSTLLLLSPSGEWPCGGRSGHHQWNEAQIAVIAEINARRWKAHGRMDVAGAFKRAAHLALLSVERWRRPSGELWIVKNRAEPGERHGFEPYSFHSQYNLLAAAMLALAYLRADDTIEERPVCAEYGSYVFDLRDTFHKICACAGGTYALIETSADPHYDATGLVRVHRRGLARSAISDNAAALRTYGPPSDETRMALAPGLTWSVPGEDGAIHSLASDVRHGDGEPGSAGETPALGDVREEPEAVSFAVRYDLGGDRSLALVEVYRVASEGVSAHSRLSGDTASLRTGIRFPVLVSDGADDVAVTVSGASATAVLDGDTTRWSVVSPAATGLKPVGIRVPGRNGWMAAFAADLPLGAREARWTISLAPRSGAAS